ncbi:MAG: thioredoxin family protein [Tannerella sp.]|jgi:hypothetical protein|nr:thioredoxin family protein [Tannerella sp.]
MKRIVYVVFLSLVLQVFSLGINAQNTMDSGGFTWYLKKAEAFDAARSQDKQVLLFWGSTSCSRCEWVKKNFASVPVVSVLEKHYILWFCDATENHYKNSADVSDYLSHLTTSPPYPAVCIIDTSDIKVGHGLMIGEQNTVSALYAMLNGYVDNKQIISRGSRAYISGNNLTLESDFGKELIHVYSITGSLVDQFVKTDYSYNRDVSAYPKGILLVNSNSGWTRKVISR